jgi:hypothetical protein
MIPPQATRQVIARDGCLLRTGVAVGGEKDAHPILLSHNNSAAHRGLVSRDARRGGMLSPSVSSPFTRTRIGGADVGRYRIARVTLE